MIAAPKIYWLSAILCETTVPKGGGMQVSEKKNHEHVDFTKYPEGFEAAMKLLDFLPDEEKARRRFMMGLLDTLAKR